jgi:hypothetical protein
MQEKESFTDKELSPLAEILARRFINRWDMYPKQLDDGSYVTMHEALHVGLLLGHLRGQITLGAYVLDEDSRGRFLVLDADEAPDWRRLQALASVLFDMGSVSYLERSRRAGHLWLFFSERKHGKEARHFGLGLLAYFGIEDIELFPKQDKLSTGPGSLIRLPFGVHRKDGRRYGFYRPDMQPLAATLREQMRILGTPETLSETLFERFREHGSNIAAERFSRLAKKPWRADLATSGDAPLSERIKTVIPVRHFILRYVELSKAGRGHCPFHDDRHPSFSATDEYWSCFAGCGGGDLIHFWMKWQECNFKTAITELAEMLLE